MVKIRFRYAWWFAVGLLITYWRFIPTSVTGHADSDEMLLSGSLLATAHPPGYSILSALAYVITKIGFFVPKTMALNLTAALLVTVGMGLVGKAMIILMTKFKPEVDKNVIYFGSYCYGLTGLIWLYATRLEVMSMTIFWVGLICFLLANWIAKPTTLKLLITSGVVGVAISFYQPLGLLIPGLVASYVAIEKGGYWIKVKMVGLAAIVLIVGFLAGSSLVFLTNNNPVYGWRFRPSIEGFAHLILRKDYQGNFLERNVSTSNSYVGNGLAKITRGQFIQMLKQTYNYQTPVVILFILVGLFIMAKKWKIGFGLYLIFLLPQVWFSTLVSIEGLSYGLETRLLTGISERQYLVMITMLGIPFITGLVKLTNMIDVRKSGKVLSWGLMLLLTISMLFANVDLVKNSPHKVIEQYLQSILRDLPENSYILCASDITCFGLNYLNLVDKVRPDVRVISKLSQTTPESLTTQLLPYVYKSNPFYTAEILSYALVNHRVFVTNLDVFYVEYLGMNGDPFYLSPKGLYFELATAPTKSSPVDNNFLSSLAAINPDERDMLSLGLKDYFSSLMLHQGQIAAKLKHYDQANDYIEASIWLAPHNDDATAMATNYLQFNQQFGYRDVVVIEKNYQNFLNLGKQMELSGQFKEAYDATRKAHYLKPWEKQPLEDLARILNKSGYAEIASEVAAHLTKL